MPNLIRQTPAIPGPKGAEGLPGHSEGLHPRESQRPWETATRKPGLTRLSFSRRLQVASQSSRWTVGLSACGTQTWIAFRRAGGPGRLGIRGTEWRRQPQPGRPAGAAGAAAGVTVTVTVTVAARPGRLRFKLSGLRVTSHHDHD